MPFPRREHTHDCTACNVSISAAPLHALSCRGDTSYNTGPFPGPNLSPRLDEQGWTYIPSYSHLHHRIHLRRIHHPRHIHRYKHRLVPTPKLHIHHPLRSTPLHFSRLSAASSFPSYRPSRSFYGALCVVSMSWLIWQRATCCPSWPARSDAWLDGRSRVVCLWTVDCQLSWPPRYHVEYNPQFRISG